MRIDARAVERLRVHFRPRAYLRLTPLRFAATPLGMGFGETRFASPSQTFRLLYIARTLVTAIAETVVRDRFVGRAARRVTEEEIEGWGVVAVTATEPLSLLDLRTTGAVMLGIPTNAVRGKAHGTGRRFSEALYRGFPKLDGILYPSRLTNDPCVAVYDRAVAKLEAGEVRPVIRQPRLVPALAALNVTVLAK
jgi:hypothetical protein